MPVPIEKCRRMVMDATVEGSRDYPKWEWVVITKSLLQYIDTLEALRKMEKK